MAQCGGYPRATVEWRKMRQHATFLQPHAVHPNPPGAASRYSVFSWQLLVRASETWCGLVALSCQRISTHAPN